MEHGCCVAKIAERLCGGPFTLEYKLDGERVQLHGRIATDGAEEYSVFSRRTENVTEKYLDVAQFVGASANSGVHSFVMDAEAVAMDSQGAILPFQTLTTRKRYAQWLCGMFWHGGVGV